MKDFEVLYILADDNGGTSYYLPIILEIGTIFQNEYYYYKVESYHFNSKELGFIHCIKIE